MTKKTAARPKKKTTGGNNVGSNNSDNSSGFFYRHKRCVSAKNSEDSTNNTTPSVEVCEEDNRLFQGLVEECCAKDAETAWTNGRGVPNVKRISNTRLFKLLRSMPKGALLHAHFPAMVDWTLLLTRVLESPELQGKIYYLRNPQLLREFISNEPWLKRNSDAHVWNAPSGFTKNTLTVFPDAQAPPGWELLNHGTAAFIARQMSTSHSWEALRKNNSLPWSLIKNDSVFRLYFRLLLEEAIADGVQHVELKTNLGNLHTKYRYRRGNNAGTSNSNSAPVYDGRWMTEQDEINAMLEVYEDPRFDFKRRITFRLILGAHRSSPPLVLDRRFDTFLGLYRGNKHVIGGVDIFGYEDGNKKNKEFMGTLRKLASAVKDDGTDFVFSVHSGETANVEYPVDSNLVSLLKLEARVRVGHGLSLWKYPRLEKMFADSGKHIEVSPLSNVILGYVDRVSNHPGLRYHDGGIPISISSDDPSYFGYNYVSYDWFMAVVAWKLQLQDVVCICLNSIAASALLPGDKAKLRNAYTRRLKVFVNALRENTDI
jgi:adenosine deaminase CECR1